MKYELSQCSRRVGETIVNTASIMGLVGSWSRSGAYVASNTWGRGIDENARIGVRHRRDPGQLGLSGYIRTTSLRKPTDASTRDGSPRYVARHPVVEDGLQPEEIAEAVGVALFGCSFFRHRTYHDAWMGAMWHNNCTGPVHWR
jgi:hypothetical protein